MKIDRNDPRLTAYALGEMAETERAEFEGLLAADADARRELEEIRRTSTLLTEQLAAEPSPQLAGEQRSQIHLEIEKRHSTEETSSGFGAALWWFMNRVAPVVALVVVAGLFLHQGIGTRVNQKLDSVNMNLDGDHSPRARQDYRREAGSVALAPPATDSYGGVEPGFNTEAYDRIVDNAFQRVTDEPLSTFSVDVDTASYANVRRFLNSGRLPPKDAVRIEELINYFDYAYAPPTGSDPFAAHIEVTECPWNPQHRLARIGLKGRVIESKQRPVSNLVFLIDVSGSMQPGNKLPLVKRALRLLVEQLTENDRVALVVYAGAAGQVLPSTTGDEQEKILDAIERLQSGGSTHGSQGIQLAYDVATQNFIKGGVNRVILCTDGDFNVGVTNQGDLTRLIEKKAQSGVFLSVLGFGMGNLKDSTMEKLADKGNGNYAHIDSLQEARKVLVEQVSGTLVTIAKDVKIQVEFNPAKIAGYRLIGYENRMLRKEDFNDDKKDAGEIGAGHTVTALYEIVPAGTEITTPSVDPLKYQTPGQVIVSGHGNEAFTLKLRYKDPEGETSRLLTFPVGADFVPLAQASPDTRFAAAVAGFGMLLRDSEHKGLTTCDSVLRLANTSLGRDEQAYRAEFVSLVKTARQLGRTDE